MPMSGKEDRHDFWKTLASTGTDTTGHFELAADFDAQRFPGRTVIVKAQGAGVTGRFFFGDTVREGAGQDERLRNPAAQGRHHRRPAADPRGAPARGVTISLASIEDGENEFETDGVMRPQAGEDNGHWPDCWPKSWTTDQLGRFRIDGIVPEKMIARLSLRHPDFADDRLCVSTGLRGDEYTWGVKPVDARFTHTLEPARPVSGIVTDKKTGTPLAGVHVHMLPVRSGNEGVAVTTDASGRYRAAGGGGESFWVTAYPDPPSGYLPLQMRDIAWPIGAKVLNVDLALPKGQIVRGCVVEGKEGKPVKGASVIYQPAPSNPLDDGDYDFDNPVLTDESGKFTLTALPGSGLLAVEGPTGDYIRVAVEGLEVGRRSTMVRPHGFAWIDVPAENAAAAADARVTLRKGVKLEARIVGPDGSPLDVVAGWCAEWLASQLDNCVSPGPIQDGVFELEGADPERSYRAFFLAPERKLGAVAELKYDPNGPVIVRLQPTATVTGTMVDEKGRPLQRSQILPWIVLTRDERELKVEDFDDEGAAVSYTMWTGERLQQIYPAEFKYDSLIPGVRYYVGAHLTYHAIGALKPGEVRDLGKIVVKQQPEHE